DKTIHAIFKSVHYLFAYYYCYIFKYYKTTDKLLPIEIHGILPLKREDIAHFKGVLVSRGDGLSGNVVKTKRTIRISSATQKARYAGEPQYLHHIQSYISIPIMWNHELTGVITLAHHRKNAYTKRDEIIMEILASHAAVAIQNATHFEKTQADGRTDQLTGLCNYHYFEHLLYLSLEKAKLAHQPISLILLDIDHFKTINDKYGHLAGNQLLIQLAEVMVGIVGASGIVARYGGEEFTILIENASEKETRAIAEMIRQQVEQHAFIVEDGLQNHKNKEIQLTVSIGIASYPGHADDPLSLIRHADRAMYIGAKQAGRNKVAIYEAG
ncbi:MAG: sensor domain-containing diguanylate cyclase, partial [Bacilli bacterium]